MSQVTGPSEALLADAFKQQQLLSQLAVAMGATANPALINQFYTHAGFHGPQLARQLLRSLGAQPQRSALAQSQQSMGLNLCAPLLPSAC